MKKILFFGIGAAILLYLLFGSEKSRKPMMYGVPTHKKIAMYGIPEHKRHFEKSKATLVI